MESAMFRTLVQVESRHSQDHHGQHYHSLPTTPQRVVSRTYPAVPQDNHVELQRLHTSRDAPASGWTTPTEELDLEMSRPATPTRFSPRHSVGGRDDDLDGVVALQSLSDPKMNRFRLAAVCMNNLLGGLNDSAPGALIPYMEKYYNIGYATVSLIFIGNALGFILAAPLIDNLRARLGRGKLLALSQALMVLGYLPIICTAPFPAIVVGFFFIGAGFAISLAIGNVFCANLQNGTTMLGAMHGSYGLGGTVGPLIATAVVTTTDDAFWSRYYFLPLGLCLCNLVFATWSFWHFERDLGDDTARLAYDSSPATTGRLTAMLAAFKSKIVVLGALFIFAYQGAEVSISGWVISFLIATRPDGDLARVGYVTAGFWAGITLGRFLLAPLAPRVGGEKPFVYGLVVGSAIFEALVWWVPNVIGDAVSLAVVGLLLGPVYPCAAAVFTRNLGRHLQVSGLGVISAFGSSGGAVAPFATGALAQAAGTFVLHPIAIGLFCVMMGCWYGIPGIRKRTE